MKKLIPFDYEQYKAGAKAVFRNLGEEYKIIDVQHYPQSTSDYKLVAIWLNVRGQLQQENVNEEGLNFYKSLYEGNRDLMLEVEVEDEQPRERWVNLYLSLSNFSVFHSGTFFNSKEKAIDHRDNSKLCIGQFKVESES